MFITANEILSRPEYQNQKKALKVQLHLSLVHHRCLLAFPSQEKHPAFMNFQLLAASYGVLRETMSLYARLLSEMVDEGTCKFASASILNTYYGFYFLED